MTLDTQTNKHGAIQPPEAQKVHPRLLIRHLLELRSRYCSRELAEVENIILRQLGWPGK